MANNPYVNKVVFGSATLVDLTGTTATADKILTGYGAFGADGAWMDGTATASSGSGVVWQDSQGYVHLSDDGDIPLQTKTVSPSETAQIVTADSGYYALDKVNVGAISSTYVGSGITRRSSTDLNASGATVTVPSGYYSAQASKAVASGTAGTPTATKGTVSNHSISVTPSVTNSAGYITGGTKNGTAVTVSASELVSGTYSVTSSGTKDVTNYASASVPSGTAGTPTATKGTVSNHSVSVTPSVTNSSGYITGSTKTGTAVTVTASELASGNKAIIQNGTGIDVVGYSTVSVDVPSSGVDIPIFTITYDENYEIDSVTCNKTYSECYNLWNVDANYAGEVNIIYADEYTTSYGLSTAGLWSTALYFEGGNMDAVPNFRVVYYPNGTITATENPYTVTSLYATGNGTYGGQDTLYNSVDVAVSPNLTTKTITANGIYYAEDDNADGYSAVTVSVSGGGGEPAPKKQINFIDYDGTILHSYTKTEWQSVTTLPSNPAHTGLTAQGWNWTKNQIDAQLTDLPNGEVWVGQMYITDDGKTRIYIHLEKGRLHPYLGICPNGTVVVDWGDNSATSTLTGTSLTSVKQADHTYASGGDYMITLTVSSGSFAFYGVANTSHILKKENSTTSNIHRVYTNAVRKIELGSGANIGNYAFNYCGSLESITIPSSVTSMGSNAFYYCFSLKNIIMPNSLATIGSYSFNYCYSLESISISGSTTTIGSYSFYYCYALSNVTIPSGVTSIASYTFRNCASLASIAIPSSVTSINNYAFTDCISLSSLTIPSGVTSIGTSAFSSCYGIGEYHIKPTAPPTLSSTNAFTSIQSDCVIYVPSASLSTYKTTSNWSTYESYMQGE